MQRIMQKKLLKDSMSGKIRFSYWSYIVIVLLVLSLSGILLSGSSVFADWYTIHIYRHIAELGGWITDPIPFLLGEILMYLAAAAAVIGIILLVIRILLIPRLRKEGGHKKIQTFIRHYMQGICLAVCITLFLYTALWIIPFHTTPLNFGTDPEKVYTVQELAELRNMLTGRLNKLTALVDRDEEGHVSVPGSVDEMTGEAVLNLKTEFETIGSYAPKGKTALCSMFLSWMNIGGFTFPCTQEILLNKYVDQLYYPTLYAHETAHHMGFYREDEGVFISFLALSSSENQFLQYSAYSSIWGYVQSAYRSNLLVLDEEEQNLLREEEIQLDIRVSEDEEYFAQLRDAVYEEEVSDAAEEAFSGVSESAAETGWEIQGNLLEEAGYDGVVELLLRYYDSEINS